MNYEQNERQTGDTPRRLNGGMQLGASVGKQITPVEQSRAELDSNINSLHKILSELENRLGPVLGPPAPAGDCGAEAPSNRTIAAQIADSARGVRGAINRVDALLSRLEV